MPAVLPITVLARQVTFADKRSPTTSSSTTIRLSPAMTRRGSGIGLGLPFLGVFIISCFLFPSVLSQPATLPFHDCFSGNSSQKLNISTVYAQVLDIRRPDVHLNFTLFGVSDQGISGYSNESNLATLFTSTNMLTFNVWSYTSYFCSTLRPPSPLPAISVDNTYCPVPPGPFGFSVSIPWSDHNELTTLSTRLRAVDGFNSELFCLDVPTTLLKPGTVGSPYGDAAIILWSTVALAISYWVVVGAARIVSALGRGASRPAPGWWAKVQQAGFICASAISGDRLSSSRALLRFCTPSFRDVIFHTQWCAALAMVAVQWPSFVYPVLSQTAWSMLLYNVTLTPGARLWDPLSVLPYRPPPPFADQVSNSSSPLHIDSQAPNVLFALPLNATPGMSSFAFTVGLYPEDLFAVCLILFLTIIAVTIALSSFIWLVDWVASISGGTMGSAVGSTRLTQERSPRISTTQDLLNPMGAKTESSTMSGHNTSRPTPRFASTARKPWWRIRPSISPFHWSVLHGNLVRILVWFHFPVTIFSCYQMSNGRPRASLASVVLAAFSFVLFSILLPVFLVIRVRMNLTQKLYGEMGTLLSLGPLYNHYRHGSQLFAVLLFATNLAFGITIGCGQRSGTAQAVVILVIEVFSALVTSVWLPWGQGAGMGLCSFLFCVSRIIIAVLLVILSPSIAVGDGPGGWVAYGILIILALVFLALFLMLLCKLVEGAIRIFARIGFDRRKHTLESGLFGICSFSKFDRRRRRRHPLRGINSSPTGGSSGSSVPVIANMAISSTSGPTSVLRPEHALRPYREETDDETGYIMGAWQPFPRASYTSVPDNQPTNPPAPTPATPGFMRVSGGRAHYDAPYAIASGSDLTSQSADDVGAAQRVQILDLPPGAMKPAQRTVSQRAVIEHPAHTIPTPLRADTFSADDNHDMPASRPSPPSKVFKGRSLPTKKRLWQTLRRGKWYSEGDTPQETDEEVSSRAPTPPSPEPETRRSFVVIRPRRPQVQGQSQQHSSPESSSPEPPKPLESAPPPPSDNVTPGPSTATNHSPLLYSG